MVRVALIFLLFCFFYSAAPPSWAQKSQIRVFWNSDVGLKELKSWSLELGRVKQKIKIAREKDPITLQNFQWKGVLLSQVLDRILDELSLEENAQVDLVVLKGRGGHQALLPRSFLTKYPVLLSFERNGKSLSEPGFQSVVLSTEHPKALRENLPIEKFYLSGIQELELSNYRKQFRNAFLKQRTDPIALRGEKHFVQNCLSCHSIDLKWSHPTSENFWLDRLKGKHQSTRSQNSFDERDWRALGVYFQTRLLGS